MTKTKNSTIPNSMVTREQYDSLQSRYNSDIDLISRNSAEVSAMRRAREASLRRALKIRNRWIIVLATVLLMQSVAIIATVI